MSDLSPVAPVCEGAGCEACVCGDGHPIVSAPVSEAEVRERLAHALHRGTQTAKIMTRPENHRGALAVVGLRYDSGKYYDLQEQG